MQEADEGEKQAQLVRKILLRILPFGPATARDAYGMFKGEHPSDDEWREFGAIWERHWDECVEMHAAVARVKDALNEAYRSRQGWWKRWLG